MKLTIFKVRKQKMKIFYILVAAAIGRSDTNNLKRALLKVDLESNPKLRRMLEESIGKFNMRVRVPKREISFDPAALGCKWGYKRTLACKNAEITKHIGSQIIHPQ